MDINSQGLGRYTPLMVTIVAEKGTWRIRSHSGHAVRLKSQTEEGDEETNQSDLLPGGTSQFFVTGT